MKLAVMGANLKSLLGSRVRAAREAKELTQEQLAERIERSVQMLSNLERGKSLPSAATLMLVANALGMTLSQLFEDAENPPPTKRARLEIQLQQMAKHLPETDLEVAIVQIEALLKRR